MGVDARVGFEGRAEEEEPPVGQVGGETAGLGSGSSGPVHLREDQDHKPGEDREAARRRAPLHADRHLGCSGTSAMPPQTYLYSLNRANSSGAGAATVRGPKRHYFIQTVLLRDRVL